MCSSKRRILWGKSWPSWPSRPSWLLKNAVFVLFLHIFSQKHGFTTWYTVDILYNTLVVFKMFHPSTNGILSRYWAHFWRIESFTCFHFGLSNPPRICWRKKSASTNHACERNPFIQSGPSKPKKVRRVCLRAHSIHWFIYHCPNLPLIFFVICFFFNSKSSKQPQVAFGLGVAFLVTQQLPWAFSLLGALVIDGLCSVLKKVIDEPRPAGSYREGPGMPSHLADRKAVKVPPQKRPHAEKWWEKHDWNILNFNIYNIPNQGKVIDVIAHLRWARSLLGLFGRPLVAVGELSVEVFQGFEAWLLISGSLW